MSSSATPDIAARLAASPAFQALLVSENSAAAVHLLQMSKRSAAAEEVIATPQFQSILVRDTATALAILDIFKNNTQPSQQPAAVAIAAAVSPTAAATTTAAQPRLLRCSGCGTDKAKSDFSKNQLELRAGRKCKACIEQEIAARQQEQRERARAERQQRMQQHQPQQQHQQQQNIAATVHADPAVKQKQQAASPPPPGFLRCSVCTEFKNPATGFSKGQLKVAEAHRKCIECGRAALEQAAIERMVAEERRKKHEEEETARRQQQQEAALNEKAAEERRQAERLKSEQRRQQEEEALKKKQQEEELRKKQQQQREQEEARKAAPTTLKCSICGKEKAVADYSLNQQSRPATTRKCKSCVAEELSNERAEVERRRAEQERQLKAEQQAAAAAAEAARRKKQQDEARARQPSTSNKSQKPKSTTTSRINQGRSAKNAERLMNKILRAAFGTRFAGNDDDDDNDDEDVDSDVEEGMYGFTRSECEELMMQGVKPWDDDAHAVLAVLRGEDEYGYGYGDSDDDDYDYDDDDDSDDDDENDDDYDDGDDEEQEEDEEEEEDAEHKRVTAELKQHNEQCKAHRRNVPASITESMIQVELAEVMRDAEETNSARYNEIAKASRGQLVVSCCVCGEKCDAFNVAEREFSPHGPSTCQRCIAIGHLKYAQETKERERLAQQERKKRTGRW